MATKPGGGEAKGLSGRATQKRTFFAASLIPKANDGLEASKEASELVKESDCHDF